MNLKEEDMVCFGEVEIADEEEKNRGMKKV